MIPVIAVFDVGKTNKKLFLIDEDYRIVFERTARFTETEDEDGYPCENLESLRLSVFDSLAEVFKLQQYQVKAVNFSAYGASFVYVDEYGTSLTPLYNYLKPYPKELSEKFYRDYGAEAKFCLRTASPALGSLNSGLQLYRLKYEQPEVFEKLSHAMHLPQYLSFMLTGEACSDMTSIGCHTGMWDFEKNRYHEWINQEDIAPKLPRIVNAGQVTDAVYLQENYKAGIGLHDSSAALIPYLLCIKEPFVLISTGTWNISLNPFNQSPLTPLQLKNDCLQYLQYDGKPVMASRLFAGFEHDKQVKRIAEHFSYDAVHFRNLDFDQALNQYLCSIVAQDVSFNDRDLIAFRNPDEAYLQLMRDLVREQKESTQLIMGGVPVKSIFVDGGFSKNKLFMNLLAMAFPDKEVFAAMIPQASAIGAAMVIHQEWNSKALRNDMMDLICYSDHSNKD